MIVLARSRSIGTDVAMFLAESIPSNVRILEGALTKMAAQSSLEGVPIDLDLAKTIIEKYYQSVGLIKPSFDQILEAVSKHTRIPVNEIKGVSRKAPIAHARHVAVYVTREITRDSWKHIGALFGNRDHTSMMHGYKKIRDLMNRDRELNASVRLLLRDLHPEA
jgi:chromosomal replication initiator protein